MVASIYECLAQRVTSRNERSRAEWIDIGCGILGLNESPIPRKPS